ASTSSAGSTVSAAHRLSSNISSYQHGYRKGTMVNNDATNTLVTNGFASGSTINRFVPNGSVSGSSPFRGNSSHTVPNGGSSLRNGGSPRCSLARFVVHPCCCT
ncbi:unnamed protein product, partial [Gongylonema pulchrum]|uniref:Microtubule-associated protein Jupiter n=1 Tax=Gongylonema pulchrum TaxID=637853 RepID=A0A183DLS4_9BILA